MKQVSLSNGQEAQNATYNFSSLGNKEFSIFDSSVKTRIRGNGLLIRKKLSDEKLVWLFINNEDEEALNEIVSRYKHTDIHTDTYNTHTHIDTHTDTHTYTHHTHINTTHTHPQTHTLHTHTHHTHTHSQTHTPHTHIHTIHTHTRSTRRP